MIKSVKNTKKDPILQNSHRPKRPTSHHYDQISLFNLPHSKQRFPSEPEPFYLRAKQRKISLSQKSYKQNYGRQSNMINSQIETKKHNNNSPLPSPYFPISQLQPNQERTYRLSRQRSDNRIFTKMFRENQGVETDTNARIENKRMLYHNEYGYISSPRQQNARPKSKLYQNRFDKFFQQNQKMIRQRENSNNRRQSKKLQQADYSTNQSLLSNDLVNTSKASVKFDMSPYLY